MTYDGTFTFDLPPGTYDFSATGFGGEATDVVVVAGKTTNVQMFVSYP